MTDADGHRRATPRTCAPSSPCGAPRSPLPLSATVDHDGDTVRITAQTTVDRTAFGVSGNMIGMMPPTTTLIADLVFAKA